MYQSSDVTVAIPTFGRDQVLIDTIRGCLDDPHPPGEVIVVDQTPQHDADTEHALRLWHDAGDICWVRLTVASQPAAMNHALMVATRPLVLFLDDDIIPKDGFVAAHAAAFGDSSIWAVVGQIIQPWQTPTDADGPSARDDLRADFDFPFHSIRRSRVRNVMSGHMSVIRTRALEVGGFDENFQGAAYRFDTEFGRRILHAGGQIVFEPAASIRHLRAVRGGTRIHGDHLASASPNHGVGDYYFALLEGSSVESLQYASRRVIREVCTRFHLRHPWYIPVKLVGELRALIWALQLYLRGPKLIGRADQ